MSEEKTSHSHGHRHKRRRRFSHRGNKLLQFLARYKFQLLTALLLVIALIVVLVLLISELFFRDESLLAAQIMLTRV